MKKKSRGQQSQLSYGRFLKDLFLIISLKGLEGVWEL